MYKNKFRIPVSQVCCLPKLTIFENFLKRKGYERQCTEF